LAAVIAVPAAGPVIVAVAELVRLVLVAAAVIGGPAWAPGSRCIGTSTRVATLAQGSPVVRPFTAFLNIAHLNIADHVPYPLGTEDFHRLAAALEPTGTGTV
jgi:hypothetical protein